MSECIQSHTLEKIMKLNDPASMSCRGGKSFHIMTNTTPLDVWTDILDDLTRELVKLDPSFDTEGFRAACSSV